MLIYHSVQTISYPMIQVRCLSTLGQKRSLNFCKKKKSLIRSFSSLHQNLDNPNVWKSDSKNGLSQKKVSDFYLIVSPQV